MNGLPELELKKPSAVVAIRWYSFYESALTTLKLWRYLMMFLDSPVTNGEKVNDLCTLLGDNEVRQKLYVKLVFVIEILRPIHGIQKLLESGEPLLHKMYHIVASNLQSIQIISLCVMKLPLLFICFPYLKLKKLDLILKHLVVGADKWQATCSRNLSATVGGPTGLWKQALVLDPFLKSSQPQVIDDYSLLFNLVTDLSSIKEEFTAYLMEPVPGNPSITTIEYWHSVQQIYPLLSQPALELLCISTESVDVERSFSKLRKLQHPTRSSMSQETLRMNMTLFFNQDIQNHFCNY